MYCKKKAALDLVLRFVPPLRSNLFSASKTGGSKTQVTGQARLQVRSQVRSSCRSGQVTGQVRPIGRIFSAKEIDYIFGVDKNLVLSTELIM